MRLATNLAAAAAVVALAGVAVNWRAGAREAAAEAAFPPTGQIIEVAGARIHAQVMGSGPDLVLLHGAGGSLRDFTFDLAGRLAERYRVIAFDRPGHGHSAGPVAGSETYDSLAAQATLLQAAAAELGVERPLVLGHSFGGAVALAWALAAPERTAGLVILGGAAMPWPGKVDVQYRINASPPGSAIVVPLLAGLAPDALSENVISYVFSPQPVPQGYTAHFGPDLSLRRTALRANARQVYGLKPQLIAMVPRYGSLERPVEIVHGDADPILGVDLHARGLAAELPNAALTVLPGIGHMPHHADPDAAIAAVDRAAARAGLR